MYFLFLAEDETEPEEEDKSEEQPRDSGCFESSENLESGREEPKTEEALEVQENQEHERDRELQKEDQRQPLDVVQEQLEEQLQDLTLVEGS